MEILQSHIEQLNEFCSALIKGADHLTAEDIVQDAIIKLLESDKPFSIHEARKLVAYQVTTTKQGFVSASFKPTAKVVKQSNNLYPCKVCKELLPGSMFSVQNTNGKAYVKTTCNKCYAKLAKERMNKNPIARQKYNIRMREYAAKNRALHNKRNAEAEKYNKDNLTDTYIKKLLRHKFPNPTQEQIEAKRLAIRLSV